MFRSVWKTARHCCVSQGMEFAQTVTMPLEPPPAEPAEAAPESGDNGARANDAPTPPPAPVEGSQAETGPGEGAAVRPAATAAATHEK